jgi:hypothetical protein
MDQPGSNVVVPSNHSVDVLPSLPRLASAFGIVGLLLFPWLAVAGDVAAYPAPNINLASYKTFKILPVKLMTKSGLQENEPTISPFIVAALRRELTAKGLTEVAENPDLEIASLGTAVSVPQLEAVIYSYLYSYDTSIIGTSPLATIGRYNREGTLYVNMIDPRLKKGAWLGISTRALNKPSKIEGDIDKAMQAMFKKYPALK